MIKTLPILGFQDNDIEAYDASIDQWVDSAHSDVEKIRSENPSKVQRRTAGKFTIESVEIGGGHVYLVAQKAKPVGVLILQRNDDGVWATETIGVLPEYQGQSVGTLLYEAALSDLGKIGSSTSLSGGSSKVWKAMCLKHKGTFVIPADYGQGRPIEVQIKGWSVEGGITYPMFSTPGGTIVSLRSLFTSNNGRAAKEGYYLIKAFGSNSKVNDNWPV